jgi:hypothetical protein
MDKILMIVKLLPALIEVIKAAEAAIPGEGKGEAKLAMVRGILTAVDSAIEQMWPSLEKVIAVIVSTFNAVKAWR